MKKYSTFFISTYFGMLSSSQVFSQAIPRDTIAPSIINTAGGSGAYKNVTIEWSIGEAATTEMMSSTNFVFTNGILQPMPTSHYIDTHWSVDEIRIYPNPSRDWVTIDFFSIEMGKVFITVTDASGRLMNRIVFDYYGTGRREMLNVSRYASGNYFIRIQKGIYPLTNSIQKDGTYSIQVLR